MSDKHVEYSWAFIRELVGWSRWVALAAAAIGFAVTRDWRFPLAVGIAAGIDIWTLSAISRSGERAVREAGHGGNVHLTDVVHYMGIRVGAKAVLLLAAVSLPWLLDFWGMVVGVLIVDATVFTIGTVTATLRLLGAALR